MHETSNVKKTRLNYSLTHLAYLMPREPKRLRFGIRQHTFSDKDRQDQAVQLLSQRPVELR